MNLDDICNNPKSNVSKTQRFQRQVSREEFFFGLMEGIIDGSQFSLKILENKTETASAD